MVLGLRSSDPHRATGGTCHHCAYWAYVPRSGPGEGMSSGAQAAELRPAPRRRGGMLILGPWQRPYWAYVHSSGPGEGMSPGAREHKACVPRVLLFLVVPVLAQTGDALAARGLGEHGDD